VASVVVYLLAYLLGGILFGPLIARRAGIDLYEGGSGNPGATNVERLVGHRAALLVLGLDAAKGALAVALHAVATPTTPEVGDRFGVAFAVVLGHCAPAFAPTRGGKGVATALGAITVLDPVGGAIFVVGYLSARKASGFGSVGSLVGVALASLRVALANSSDGDVGMLGALVALVFVRHADNLARLVRGEEPRSGGAPPDVEED